MKRQPANACDTDHLLTAPLCPPVSSPDPRPIAAAFTPGTLWQTLPAINSGPSGNTVVSMQGKQMQPHPQNDLIILKMVL